MLWTITPPFKMNIIFFFSCFCTIYLYFFKKILCFLICFYFLVYIFFLGIVIVNMLFYALYNKNNKGTFRRSSFTVAYANFSRAVFLGE